MHFCDEILFRLSSDCFPDVCSDTRSAFKQLFRKYVLVIRFGNMLIQPDNPDCKIEAFVLYGVIGLQFLILNFSFLIKKLPVFLSADDHALFLLEFLLGLVLLGLDGVEHLLLFLRRDARRRRLPLLVALVLLVALALLRVLFLIALLVLGVALLVLLIAFLIGVLLTLIVLVLILVLVLVLVLVLISAATAAVRSRTTSDAAAARRSSRPPASRPETASARRRS